MSSGYYPVTGIHIDDQKPSFRKDIDAWYASTDRVSLIQVSLYIQALDFFQKIDYTDEKSYFRIAAIHGTPMVEWDGTSPKNDWFCSHQKVTFPSWHRPYLALYEQRLHEIMINDIINSKIVPFPESEKQEWTAAANKWRLPYWDYAHNPRIADIAKDQEITILDQDKGNNETKKVPNPMWSYHVTDKDGNEKAMGSLGKYSVPSYYAQCLGTSRYAQGNTEWVAGVSNSDSVTKTLSGPPWSAASTKKGSDATKNGGTIENFVGRLLARKYFRSWKQFSSTRYYASVAGREWLSLEQVHNSIHGFTGGHGHMSDPSVAAFDPIFWVHHCFIDRICAIWQLIPGNTKNWFDNPEPKDPTTINTPLYPFRKDEKGDYYTSVDVQDWTIFGYDYEDTSIDNFKQGLSAGDTSGALNRNINRLYGSERDNFLDTIASPDSAGLVAGGSKLLPKELKYDYIINVVYDRYAINNGDPYIIHFFIGDVDEAGDYTSQDSYVGSIFNFSSSFDKSGCENCKNQAEEKIHSVGQVPITKKLIQDLKDGQSTGLDSLNPERIANYLEDNSRLKVKVQNLEGQDIELATLEPTFKVAVLAGTADYSSDDEVLPRYEGHTLIWWLTPQNSQEGNQEADYNEAFATSES